MDDQLAVTIFIVLVVFVIIFSISYHFFNMTGYASFTLGLLVAFLILLSMYPPSMLSNQESNGIMMMYLFIMIAIPAYLTIYLFLSLFWTKRS